MYKFINFQTVIVILIFNLTMRTHLLVHHHQACAASDAKALVYDYVILFILFFNIVYLLFYSI